MKNPYKRNDVFTCHYSRHAAFANRVSAWHVLVAKKCYPQGCLEFKWSCALLNKGKRCSRGFNRMGRLCPGCAHYRDEKVHYQPCLQLTPAGLARFQQDLEAFDEWVAEHQGREQDVTLRIAAVKPRFLKEIDSQGARLRLDGFLLIAREGFIGRDALEESFFAVITPQQQERLALAPGDLLDARGAFSLDQGRILFPRLHALEVSERIGAAAWRSSQALVARQSARTISGQPEQCLQCCQGALVDVIDRRSRPERPRRELICLEGIENETACYYQTALQLEENASGCPVRHKFHP
ncbi:MAG TPA: hypothetical protein PKI62_11490 [bacterium]|nr:hypothetical protein [bacterium]HPR88014.1 hypothetical protein [bacterium]